MTHLLRDKLEAMMSEDDPIPKTEIRDMLQKIKQQHENTFIKMNHLESAYRRIMREWRKNIVTRPTTC